MGDLACTCEEGLPDQFYEEGGNTCFSPNPPRGYGVVNGFLEYTNVESGPARYLNRLYKRYEKRADDTDNTVDDTDPNPQKDDILENVLEPDLDIDIPTQNNATGLCKQVFQEYQDVTGIKCNISDAWLNACVNDNVNIGDGQFTNGNVKFITEGLCSGDTFATNPAIPFAGNATTTNITDDATNNNTLRRRDDYDPAVDSVYAKLQNSTFDCTLCKHGYCQMNTSISCTCFVNYTGSYCDLDTTTYYTGVISPVEQGPYAAPADAYKNPNSLLTTSAAIPAVMKHMGTVVALVVAVVIANLL